MCKHACATAQGSALWAQNQIKSNAADVEAVSLQSRPPFCLPASEVSHKASMECHQVTSYTQIASKKFLFQLLCPVLKLISEIGIQNQERKNKREKTGAPS